MHGTFTPLLALAGAALTANAQVQEMVLPKGSDTNSQMRVELASSSALGVTEGTLNAVSLIMRGGSCDCFAAPEESPTPRLAIASFANSLSPGIVFANYDDPNQDKFFIESFVGLPKGCIIGGTLTITARPLGSLSFNDGLSIGQVAAVGTTFTNDFANWSYGDRVSSPPTLFPGAEWNDTARPDTCGYTTVIDLNTSVGVGSDTLISRMNDLGVLDVFSSDDTAIDCIVLNLELEQGCTSRCDPNPDDCFADVNNDGLLDLSDINTFVAEFVTGCP